MKNVFLTHTEILCACQRTECPPWNGITETKRRETDTPSGPRPLSSQPHHTESSEDKGVTTKLYSMANTKFQEGRRNHTLKQHHQFACILIHFNDCIDL